MAQAAAIIIVRARYCLRTLFKHFVITSWTFGLCRLIYFCLNTKFTGEMFRISSVARFFRNKNPEPILPRPSSISPISRLLKPIILTGFPTAVIFHYQQHLQLATANWNPVTSLTTARISHHWIARYWLGWYRIERWDSVILDTFVYWIEYNSLNTTDLNNLRLIFTGTMFVELQSVDSRRASQAALRQVFKKENNTIK